MTQENKSAADVAQVIVNEVLNNYHIDTPTNITYDRIEAIITQAIQSETAALQKQVDEYRRFLESKFKFSISESREWPKLIIRLETENRASLAREVGLTAEVDRLKNVIGRLNAPDIEKQYEIGSLLVYHDCVNKVVEVASSQPYPAGFGDKFLKLARDGYFRSLAGKYEGDGPEDERYPYDYFQLELEESASALTPEEIKILEGYGDE